VGTYDTQLVREFFVAIINHAQMTLHIRQLDGINSHHIIEATFKAFARAMRMATGSGYCVVPMRFLVQRRIVMNELPNK
jgi:imidazoleglycerol phosphate dehydratase HisB